MCQHENNVFDVWENFLFELLLHQRLADSDSGTSYGPSSYLGISLKRGVSNMTENCVLMYQI